MKHKIYRFLLFVGLVTLSAFTLVPPAHQIPESTKFIPEVMAEMPPADSLTLVMGSADGKKGEEVCVPLAVYDFDNILSMQFSVQWDTSVLQYKRLENFGMRDITNNNFGVSMVDDGRLAFLWYDQHLLGKSRPDGFKLYDICFDVVGEAGTSAEVKITDTPTPAEVVNGAAVFLRLHSEHGTVKISD